jgi:MerR family transcriptional regulator/heat shock protein HspR
MAYEIILRAEDDEPLYLRSLAIRMARITPDFLVLCEKEGLVQARTMTGGGKGFDSRSIERLALIRRLHRELELDLEIVDMVIHLRKQIVDLQQEIEIIEQRVRAREQSLDKNSNSPTTDE